MKLYLSSYGLGNFSEELKKLIGTTGAKVAVSVNALDFSTDLERKGKRLQSELESMRSLGFEADHLDLRDYFGKPGLAEHLSKYDAVWLSGGNTFILVKAMKQSGFDEVVTDLIKPGKLVYSGYSAAFCAVSPSLRGIELVDDVNATAEGYETSETWEGYGLVDFYPIVHFRSDHPESADIEKVYEYVKSLGSKLKTFKDGDIYVVDGTLETLFSCS